MEVLGYLFIFLVIAFTAKSIFSTSGTKRGSGVKGELMDGPIKKNEVHDLYGTKKYQNEPDKFFTELVENQKKLDKGEDVGVEAAQAFFLIRNANSHNLVVGRDGKVNLKKMLSDEEKQKEFVEHVMNFMPEGREKEEPKEVMLPGYVDYVQPLKDGGVRWIFKEWHANECGIKSVCYDSMFRPIGDPDEIANAKSGKEKKISTASAEKKPDENIKIDLIDKKISRIEKMIVDERATQMLDATKKQIDESENFQKPKSIKPSDHDLENNNPKSENEINFEVSNSKNYLTPKEFIPDEVALENELPIPDFQIPNPVASESSNVDNGKKDFSETDLKNKTDGKAVEGQNNFADENSIANENITTTLLKKRGERRTRSSDGTPDEPNSSDEAATQTASSSDTQPQKQKLAAIEIEDYMTDSQKYALMLGQDPNGEPTSEVEVENQIFFGFQNLDHFIKTALPHKVFLDTIQKTLLNERKWLYLRRFYFRRYFYREKLFRAL